MLSITPYHDLLLAKYEGVIGRSFKTKLELYLFDWSLSHQSVLISPDQFLSFQATDELVNSLERAWLLKEREINGVDVNTIDREILEWHADNKALKDDLKKAYKEHFFELFPINSFAAIYPEPESMRQCAYCGITEEELNKLRKEGLIKTKNARGKHHEIDRINSNKEYTEDNIVLACYWCNNAKTDEFTFDEFTSQIGPAVSAVWKERLAKL